MTSSPHKSRNDVQREKLCFCENTVGWFGNSAQYTVVHQYSAQSVPKEIVTLAEHNLRCEDKLLEQLLSDPIVDGPSDDALVNAVSRTVAEKKDCAKS